MTPEDTQPRPGKMRPLEDIMADYIAEGELGENEERLLDLKVFEKTGKHLAKFNNPRKPNSKDKIPVISSSGKRSGQQKPEDIKVKVKKEPKIVAGVSVNGAIS